MKLIRGILVLIVLVFGPWIVWAEDNHYFGVAMEGAYTYMHPYQVDVARVKGGAGGGHLLYELEHNNFLIQIGAGFVWQQSGWSVPNTIVLPDQTYIDTQGDEMTLKTNVKRWDEVRRGMVDVPVMIGGEWGIGYLLGGVKMGIGVVDRSALKAEITTVGVYDKYFVPIHDAANHGFYTAEPIEQQYAMPTNLDVRLSLEGGLNIARITTPARATLKVRLGAFVDYGFYLTKVEGNTTYLTHEGTQLDLSTYKLQPILTTGTKPLDNLMAGVRLTVLIGAPGRDSYCPTCRILDDRWRPIHTKKRCIICEDRY